MQNRNSQTQKTNLCLLAKRRVRGKAINLEYGINRYTLYKNRKATRIYCIALKTMLIMYNGKESEIYKTESVYYTSEN